MTAATVRPAVVQQVSKWLDSQRPVIRQGIMKSPTFHQVRRALPLARVHEIAEALSRYRLSKIGRKSPQQVPTRSPEETAQDQETAQARNAGHEERKAARLAKAVADAERRQRLEAARANEEAMRQADIEKAKCREQGRTVQADEEPRPWEKQVTNPAPLRGPKKPKGWTGPLAASEIERRRAALEAAKSSALNLNEKE